MQSGALTLESNVCVCYIQIKPAHLGLINGHKTNGSLLDQVHTVAAMNYEEFLSGSHDHTIALWNSVTGERLRTFVGHTDVLSRIVKFSDSLFFSISWKEGSAKLWNMHTGDCVKTLVSEKGPFRSLVKMSESTVAAIVAQNTVELWDIDIEMCIRTFEDVHTGRPLSWSVAKVSEEAFVTATGVGVLAVWNVNSETCQHANMPFSFREAVSWLR
jgi:WD40 repeat protein